MKKIISSIIILFVSCIVIAEEGMLIPSLIAAFESDMKANGMKLTADQIYSINNSSLKDAVMHFGGGCTAEVISNKGLLLTNHHCGFYQIQSHSSLQNDYLKYGFWAKNINQELPNPGLTASRIVSIEDVTSIILFGIENNLSKEERNKKIQENIRVLIQDKKTKNDYRIEIQDFDYGNSYYCMTSEVFQDVRLVGTPPSSIGKFGGDTDNWVWPRHTGDFSMFRIYVGADNKPAPYSPNNVPYTPLYSLKIDAGIKKKDDFTMVYGFPGQTEQHLVSGQLKFITERIRPAQISMREKSLSIINSRMRSSDEIRIKYAAKQASIANSYKKWIGQIQGLRELRAVENKEVLEAAYTFKAKSNPEWEVKYGNIVDQMNTLFDKNKEYDFSNSIYIEYIYVGPEFFKLVRSTEDFIKNYLVFKEKGVLEEKIKNQKSAVERYFKDYSKDLDQTVFYLLHSEFLSLMDKNYLPNNIFSKSTEEWSKAIYDESIFTDKQKMLNFYSSFSEKSIKKLKKDPAYHLYSDVLQKFKKDIIPNLYDYQWNMDELLRVYVAGKKEMFPNDKHWPDANGTLRISYGKLEGSTPKDGLTYHEYTTIDGIFEKNKIDNPDFEILPRMQELYEQKKYGDYAQDGKLWVCFTGSNHTTGGNSGSPVLNESGELIGINFDRTWESTMSDYKFDASRCRNVVCDIRYILWCIDVYAEATNIIEELEIVR